MAQQGLCSRREADRLIASGRVLVDGAVVNQLGIRVNPDADIRLSTQAARHRETLATILLNKPPGYVSNLPEKGYPEAVSLIRRENQQRGRPGHGNDSVPAASTLNVAGRLDIDSSGLLVLTQNGSIARRLISPDSPVEKEYRVRVSGSLDGHTIAQLCHGLSLDGRVLRPARVTQHGAHQLMFVLVEGRKRQIRRMCELVGLKVNNLTRTRIGGVTLGRLPRGQWRYLESGEQF